MKIRHLTIFVTLIVFLLLGTILLKMPQFGATSRSNDPIPYIYYYSDLQAAWVIERADGTDSRLLGQGVMPNQLSIMSAEWSPSGKWFAWWGRVLDMTFTPARAWLVSSDGQEISHLLDDAVSITWLEWADDKDWLLVIFRTYEGNLNSHQVVRIIDVPNQRIVAEVRQNGLGEMGGYSYQDIYQTGWAEDNQSVFSLTNGIITRLHINGQVETWNFDTYSRLLDFSYERLVAYLGGGLSITDLSTGEAYLFPERRQNVDRVSYAVNWNSVRSHALITETACTRNTDSTTNTYTCESAKLYVLDWSNKELEALGDIYQVQVDYSDYEYEKHLLWSPDGRVAVIRDANQGIYLLDSLSYEIYPLAVDNARDWYWSSNNDLIIWEQEDTDIFRFDWASKSLELFRDLEDTNTYGGFEVSADGSVIGYYAQDVVIENIRSGELYTYPRHSTNTVFGPVYGYQWGENPEWFFSGGNTMISGSCCNARTIIIHQLQESTGRELTVCHDVDSCVGFLPDAVLPHLAVGQAESVTPAPEQVLLHEGNVIDVSWSPDGLSLASYSREANNNVLSIWDMREGTATLIQKINTELDCGVYTLPCYLKWSDSENLQFIGSVDRNHPNDPTVYRFETINLSSLQVGQERWEFQRPYRFLSQDRTYELIFEGEHNEIGHLQVVESAELLHSIPLELYSSDYYHFDYHPETDLFVGGGIYDRFSLWDAKRGQRLDWAGLTGFAAAFSPDGRQLAVASSKFVTIWDMSEYIDD